MKASLFLAISLLISHNWRDNNQTEPTFPLSVDLETVDGKIINSSTLLNDKEILALDFWNASCGPCIMAFNSIRDNYDVWNSNTGAKIIAIASQKRDERILDLIKKSNWPFEVYFDPDYKLFIATSKAHKKGQIELGFPTMFVFDKQYDIVGKLSGARTKLIDGVRPPTKDAPITGSWQDYFEVDMNHYYEFFKEIKEKK